MRRAIVLSVMLLLSGCATSTLGIGSGGGKEVPIAKMDEQLAKAFPQKRKASFGRVTIVGASVVPNEGQNKIALQAYFNLVSFEIPEGISGVAHFVGDLRYDPASHRLYASNLVPTSLNFNNKSLVEYVSNSAKKGLPRLIAGALQQTPLYQMEQSFNAKMVKTVSQNKSVIMVEFD